MAKIKTAFFCQNCGTQSAKWIGKCSICGEWNTYVEEQIEKEKTEEKEKMWIKASSAHKPILISQVSASDFVRIPCKDSELNRILGGGVVPGSFVLIGGEPGIGKSTLLLQFALSMHNIRVLYISGEESEQQIKMRAERIGVPFNECFLLCEANTQKIFSHIKDISPQIVIVDSVQTLYTDSLESSTGSISQVKECATEFMKFAKETNTAVFFIGHINKDGAIAGPKVLEHIVDTVLQFEGERQMVYRILRSLKNRFGSASEIGIYEMNSQGLKPVLNPSDILINQKDYESSGTSIASTVEGNRSLLLEIQALVSSSAYGNPQRNTTGLDIKRLSMLLAVIEKRVGIKLGHQDVFLNIVGGLKIDDPAIDLAVCIAIISSFKEKPISSKICFSSEVGLGGELRTVTRLELRIQEAQKLGFQSIYISKYNAKALLDKKFNIKIFPCGNITEVLKNLFA